MKIVKLFAVIVGIWAISYIGSDISAAVVPVVHYRFSPKDIKNKQVVNLSPRGGYAGILKGGVHQESEAGVEFLRLDGTSGYIEIEGSEGLHICDDGLTITATVRPRVGLNDNHLAVFDMFAFKPDEYLFGVRDIFARTGVQRFYSNIHSDKGGWDGLLMEGDIPRHKWSHVAVVFKRCYEPEQGINGYFVTHYLNGVKVGATEHRNIVGKRSDGRVIVGAGYEGHPTLYLGGAWHFKGDLAEVRIYDRALSAPEFESVLREETVAKVKLPPTPKRDPNYSAKLAALRERISKMPLASREPWLRLVATIENTWYYVSSETRLMEYLATISRLVDSGDKHPEHSFMSKHPEYTFLDSAALGLTFFTPESGRTVWIGLFDRKRNRELLGRQDTLWTLNYELGGKDHSLDSLEASLFTKLQIASNGKATLSWESVDFRINTRFILNGNRLELGFDVENFRQNCILRDVTFPRIAMRRFAKGGNRIFLPEQSGLIADPKVSYRAVYPSTNATMQYFAYYDAGGGVYFGIEDPIAQAKELESGGFDELRGIFSCDWWVGAPGGRGGNGFTPTGHAVIETFDGDWFDASQIYKRFLRRDAKWWPKSLPRKDTPDWYRNNSLSLTERLANKESPWQNAGWLIAFRDYLELPMSIQLYWWHNEPFDASYPKFTPRPGLNEYIARLKAAGIRVKPYLNGYLWVHTDEGYKNIGAPAAAKDRHGKEYKQIYGKHHFSVMCPSVPAWQNTIINQALKVTNYGAEGIYIDQIGAGPPCRCFDSSHSHASGSGKAWMSEGQWPMLQRIRTLVRAKNPDMILEGEDFSEPTIRFVDGFLPWRAGGYRTGEVPAFQAIYAGRVQFVGRSGCWRHDSRFAKVARQVLWGEQIGRLTNWKFFEPRFRLFVKKLAHTRHTFVDFFNEGEMLKSMQEPDGAPTVTANWGYNHTQTVIETTPAMMHSLWRKDDAILALFVNTTKDALSLKWNPNVKDWGIPVESGELLLLAEGAQPKVIKWNSKSSVSFTVPGFGVAAWIIPLNGKDALVLGKKYAPLFEKLEAYEKEEGWTSDAKRPVRQALSGLDIEAQPIIHYRFEASDIASGRIPNLMPDGGYDGIIKGIVFPYAADEIKGLRFPGVHYGYVEIKGSEGLHIGDKGLTVTAMVRSLSGVDEKHFSIYGMFILKPDEYFFGVQDPAHKGVQNLYSGIMSDKWVSLSGGHIPRSKWVQVAVVFEPLRDPAKGIDGYTVHHYLDGVRVASSEHKGITCNRSDKPINIAKGWGGNWFFNGAIAELKIFNRALKQDEIRKK